MKNACWLVVVGMGIAAGSLVYQGGATSAIADDVSADSGAQVAPRDAATAEHFESQIAPLLTRHCSECHGATSKKGRLDLSHKELALAGGDSGPSLVPGNATESLLWEFVESDEMPENRPPLSPQEKELLRQWIDAGATWPEDVTVGGTPDDDTVAGNWLRRLTVPEYIETVRQAVGVDVEREARQMLPRDLRADGFSNTAYNLSIDLAHVEAYAKLAEIIVGRMDVAAFAAEHSPCQQLSEECMPDVIAGVGKWLLRGPLEEHELAAFLRVSNAVAEEGGDFDEAVAYVVEAMLQSPRFLYRIERQRGDSGERRVGDYELASRLSYILWGGPPDRELMRAADAGELADRGKVESQVRRMLDDPRTIDKSSQFISEWLNLEQLDYLRPNDKRFPRWNAAIAADMREETLAFFNEVVWEQNRPLWDLMNAQVTFATPRLAEHYGLDPGKGVAVAETSLPVRAAERAAEPTEARAVEGLQALYTFDEGSGDAVRDTSGAGDPLDLRIADAEAVAWEPGGLKINGSTEIATAKPAKRMIEAIKKSKAVTLEAWVTPADASQNGPARIATLSSNSSARNFTLGQEGDKYDVRFRTTKTDGNGMPGVASPSGAVQTRSTHVVYTRDAEGKARMYVDGQEASARDVGGDLSNWDGNFRFAVANELSKDRPWKGTLHTVAVYSRALSADEVGQNHAAGAGDEAAAVLASSAPSAARSRDEDLQALYRFDEGIGQTVRDTSGAGETLDLRIENPAGVSWGQKGLTVKESTRIVSDGPPKGLIRAVQDSNSISLEAWITPANTTQAGPARILTLSSGTSQRNFTLGQDGDKYDVRLRATQADSNGLPGLASPGGQAVMQPTHVVYTRDSGAQARLFIDGVEIARRYVQGDLSNWDGGFSLTLANESSGDRPWLGTLHRVAIYSRALTPQEVLANSRINTPLMRYDLASVPARGGLLTQGSVLTIGGDEASMVTRGLFVLKDILYDKVGDPPPCLDTTPVPTKPGLSQREVAMDRVKSASCGGCHARFEPLAFGLEKFDGLGSYQETDEHGNKLRDDGEIEFPDQDEPVSYQSAAELMDLLAASERVRMNLTRKVTQFALGRPLVESDSPILDQIHRSAQEGGGTYASLITSIVMSDLVQMTSLESDQ